MLKKFIVLFVVLSLVFISCSPLSAPLQQNSGVTSEAGMSYLGDVNKIYSAKSGRFYTGQIIENFYGRKVKFEGNLVEYNSIKPEILAYVEGLEKNNALMHQHYEGVKYDKDKKYVEFSSYTEVSTGKILMFEIRVFFGNFLDTFNQDYWYAKSVSFNPSFTKDLDNNKKVNFGTPLGNPQDDIDIVNTGNTDSSGNQEIAEDLKEAKIINLIGEVEKIYSAPNTGRFFTGQIVDWGNGKKVRFQGNMVKYKSVKKEVLDLFNNVELNAMMNQGYSGLENEYDAEKIYIEVCSYRDVETNKPIIYELRLIDKSHFDGTWNEWYAKYVYLDASIIKKLNTTYSTDIEEPLSGFNDQESQETTEDLTEDKIINLIGDVEKIYSAPNTGRYFTGQIINWGNGKKVRFQGNMVKYKSVKKEVLDLFNNIELNAWMNQGYPGLENEYDAKKIYIEVCSYRDVETNALVEYDLHLIDKSYFEGTWNKWYAKSVTLNQAFFDNLK